MAYSGNRRPVLPPVNTMGVRAYGDEKGMSQWLMNYIYSLSKVVLLITTACDKSSTLLVYIGASTGKPIPTTQSAPEDRHVPEESGDRHVPVPERAGREGPKNKIMRTDLLREEIKEDRRIRDAIAEVSREITKIKHEIFSLSHKIEMERRKNAHYPHSHGRLDQLKEQKFGLLEREEYLKRKERDLKLELYEWTKRPTHRSGSSPSGSRHPPDSRNRSPGKQYRNPAAEGREYRDRF
ncbi:hypothetical protein Aduo_011448 [Ancylostoma duodenale]